MPAALATVGCRRRCAKRRSHALRALVLPSLSVALGLSFCSMAEASTVSSHQIFTGLFELDYTAAPGENNDVTLAQVEGVVEGATLVTDTGAIVHAGDGCRQLGVHAALCASGR